jgi:hypothetical protein
MPGTYRDDKGGGPLRFNEAMKWLNAVKDLISSQLMNAANFQVMKRMLAADPTLAPARDFDMLFFMKVVHRLCSHEERLIEILNEVAAAENARGAHPIRKAVQPAKPAGHASQTPVRALLTALFIQPAAPLVIGVEDGLAVLESVRADALTYGLLSQAAIALDETYREEKPIAPFDFHFYMDAMKEFCADHDFVRRSLVGEDLSWLDDDEWPSRSPSVSPGGARPAL